MQVRLWAAGTAAAALIAVGLLLVSTATSAAPPSRASRTVVLAPKTTLTAHLAGFSGDYAQGTIANLTPYTWTFVDDGGIGSDTHPQPRFSTFPASLKPGQDFVYSLIWTNHPHLTTWGYDGWFTYKADTLNHTEYLSVALFGEHCTGICSGSETPLAVQAYNTTAAPRYQNGVISFGSNTPNPEIGWTSGGAAAVYPNPSCCFRPDLTADFDYNFQVKGNYILDASKAPQHVADLLNAMCADAAGTSCSFTATGPLTMGLGKTIFQGAADNVDCSQPPSKQLRPLRVRAGAQPPPPPSDQDPDWHEVSVTESRETALDVGGSLSVGASFKVLTLVDAEVSVKFGAETEWSDTTSITKSVKILLPPNYIGGVWSAPVVGTVTGTLVVSTNLAKYTITNYTATKDGMSPDLKVPPFDVMTYTRPLTAAEYQIEHQEKCPTRLRAPAPIGGLG